MPQTFTCPHCAGTTLVADEFAGGRGPCVHCGREIEIPANMFSPYNKPRPARTMKWGFRPQHLRLFGVALGTLAVIAVVGFVVAVTIPMWQQARLFSQRHRSQTQLQTIAAALQAYHDANGHFPPATVVDSAGTPLYSWRVLILPYLGAKEQEIYQRFNLNEAWNSGTNRWVSNQMPAIFASPLDPDAAGFQQASYRLIVGKDTLFLPSGQTHSLDDLKDDPAFTILVVQCATRGTHFWTEPDDLEAAKMTFGVGDGSAMQLGGSDPQGAPVAFADGSTGVIVTGVSPGAVRSMSTIGKGEQVPLDIIIRPENE